MNRLHNMKAKNACKKLLWMQLCSGREPQRTNCEIASPCINYLPMCAPRPYRTPSFPLFMIISVLCTGYYRAYCEILIVKKVNFLILPCAFGKAFIWIFFCLLYFSSSHLSPIITNGKFIFIFSPFSFFSFELVTSYRLVFGQGWLQYLFEGRGA